MQSNTSIRVNASAVAQPARAWSLVALRGEHLVAASGIEASLLLARASAVDVALEHRGA